MRWSSPEPTPTRIGDRRKRKGFLLFPKRIDEVTRWLETAEWEECLIPSGSGYLRWVDGRWLDGPMPVEVITPEKAV